VIYQIVGEIGGSIFFLIDMPLIVGFEIMAQEKRVEIKYMPSIFSNNIETRLGFFD